MADPVAQLEAVSMFYPPDVHALRGVDLAVEAGASLAVMGPSGSGKTTLLNVLGLMEPPTAGEYRLGGEDTAGLGEARRGDLRGRRIGFVFQAFHLIAHLTVLENVMLPARVRRGGTLRRAAARRDQAVELLGQLGLSDKADARPGTLSGGERQRTAIARALAPDPVLLLCDEPTGSLDTSTGDSVMKLLLGLGTTVSRAVVVVTHDPDVAARADRTLTMRDGILS